MRCIIDIDGTVLDQQSPNTLEKAWPLPGAVAAVNALYDAGHQIVFYTNRNYKHMQMTIEQLRKFGFKFHHVSFSKPHGDIIIDDRAIPFSSWNSMRKLPSSTPEILAELLDIWGHNEG
ncbi:unnamed protein product [marine sediment metagenome]|uniref:FCP1 homology domain-containing protein n=1 Tax=marine sediment metagenome TaxID=412755 RepID=X1CBA5_9ZZZZ